MRYHTLFIPLVVVLSAFACGGGEGNGGGTSDSDNETQRALPFSEEEARGAAESAQLTLQDFPAGWVRQVPEPDDSGFNPDLPDECQVFIEQEEWPGTVLEVESDEFVGPDDETVQSSVTVYEDEAAASDVFDGIRQFIDDCREPLGDALSEFFRDALEEEAQGRELELELRDFHFDLMSFPEYGDESVAFRMGGAIDSSILSFDFAIDFIGTRVGNVGASISYEVFGSADSNFEQELMEIIEQRATEAAVSLE